VNNAVTEQIVGEMKRRTSLVQLIGEHVTLKKAGRSHVGLCPFHAERGPSFHVTDSEGFYYCFGCQARGDAITFLREYLGMSFREALERLSERTGVPLPSPDAGHSDPSASRAARESRDRLYALNQDAAAFYRASLGPEAVSYLIEKRGLTPDTIETFGVGWAADTWDSLSGPVLNTFQRQRDAVVVGLVAPREGAGRGHYDRFRGRVMFPVYTIAGQVAGFSGRTLSSDPETPKYLNSPESEVFSKGDLLFGLHQARKFIRMRGRAIVVEGNVDVLSMSQAGFLETVAPMGTALTEAQCQLLVRLTTQVVLAYDGDNAGQAASRKAAHILLAAGVNGRAVTLPRGEDPDSFVQKFGAEAFEALIANGRPLFDVIVDEAMAQFDGSVPAKARVVETLAPSFSLLATQAERDLYRKRLAASLGVLEGDLNRWLASARGRPPTNDAPSVSSSPTLSARPAPKLEKELMGLLLRHASALLPFWGARDTGDLIKHTGVRAVLDAAQQVYERVGVLDGALLLEALHDAGRVDAQAAVVRVLSATDPFDGDPERAFVDLCDALEAQARARDDERSRAELARLSVDDPLEALRRMENTAASRAVDNRGLSGG